MTEKTKTLEDVRIFFNFRSPYCYLASKSMFRILDRFRVRLLWRPLGGWDGRSSPDRAKSKMPISRQDVARWAKRMNVPCRPPPVTTDPTRAGCGSLLAEERGVLCPYVTAVMDREWGEAQDIGDPEVLLEAGELAGLARDELSEAMDDPACRAQLEDNWREARELGVIGVPTLLIRDQIFWGNDRLDFVREYLEEIEAS